MAKRKPERTRDDLIELVRYGNLTPTDAEAMAAGNGWRPFKYEPPPPAFDPMRVSRWSIVMAIAWIAWRDLDLVREQQADFRAECTHWLFRHWREPSEGGTQFKERSGWLLEPWSAATTARLGLLQAIRSADPSAPPMQMRVSEAESLLWQALADGLLVATALDRSGKPVDIPQRDWSYLKLFEERERDALKYDALDRDVPYTEIRLRRDDLVRLWPRLEPSPTENRPTTWPIEKSMLKPISDGGNDGYVPLCSAVLWIMTDGGTRAAMMDAEAWNEAVQALWPPICSGAIELVGLPAGGARTQPIPGQSLTVVKVLPPLVNSIEGILSNARSHISCTPYEQKHWDDYNDRLYETGRVSAAWTHLQVRKSQFLERWPRGAPTSDVEQRCYRWLCQLMQASPDSRPKAKGAFWTDAQERFPTLGRRQFTRTWQRAIADSGAHWSRSGRPGKSNRNAS